jgi:hypothetical protein
MPIPFHDLDVELAKWRIDPEDPDALRDWIKGSGSLSHLAAYLKICWPDFVEFDDCVFRAEEFASSLYAQFLEQFGGDKSAVECFLNHCHIQDLFAYYFDPEKDGSRELVRYVGRQLRELWQAKLNYQFPNRKITVEFNDSDDVEKVIDYQITFYQQR